MGKPSKVNIPQSLQDKYIKFSNFTKKIKQINVNIIKFLKIPNSSFNSLVNFSNLNESNIICSISSGDSYSDV